MYRSLKVNTLATNPLFTTAEAKDFLKVDTNADDTLIDNLIKAATQSCEIYTNRYFLDTLVTQYADKWVDIENLYKSPVSAITHIKYYDSDDSLQTLAGTVYLLDEVSQPARIGLKPNQSYPNIANRINAIEVKYTVGYGTALGVIRATKDSGKNIKVIATETRPVQQGSRLTAFELKHDGIDVSLIPDTAVGYSMANGLVDKIVVGADRILRTGHVYNKIGTYQVATMANQHKIPFYVAAPLSTFDMKSNPEDVIIEQRKGSEVTGIGDKKTAPDGINVINPAFDMTPPELIAGIITEKGVAKAPFEESIKKLFQAN